MLKVLRLIKLMAMMSEWSADTSGDTKYTTPLKFLKFFVLIFMMAHVSACAWYFR